MYIKVITANIAEFAARLGLEFFEAYCSECGQEVKKDCTCGGHCLLKVDYE